MEFSWFWIWALMASALCLGEMLTASFFLLPFGIGAAVALVTELLGGPVWLQIVIFVAASVICLFLLRPFAKKVTKDEPQKSGVGRLIGRCGLVIKAIDRESGKGLVRVEREEWNARSEDGSEIGIGKSIEVLRVEGVHLIVKQTKSLCGSCDACKPSDMKSS